MRELAQEVLAIIDDLVQAELVLVLSARPLDALDQEVHQLVAKLETGLVHTVNVLTEQVSCETDHVHLP